MISGLPNHAVRGGWQALGRPGVAIPAVGVLLAELLLFRGASRAGFSLHAATLLVCTVAPLWYEDDTGLFFAFALVPLIRLVSSGVPMLGLSQLHQTVFVYLLIVPALVLVSRLSSVAPLDVARRRDAVLAPAMVALGAGLALIEYRLITPAPLIDALTVRQVLLVLLVMVGVVSLVEEWLFRGILQATLVTEIGETAGIVVASGAFAVMHSSYGTTPELLFAGGLGLAFGLVYQKTESLLLVVLAHGTLNVVLFGILPFT